MYEPKLFIKVFKKSKGVLSGESPNRYVAGNALAKLNNAYADVARVLNYHNVDGDDAMAEFLGAEAFSMYRETQRLLEDNKHLLTSS